MPNWLQELSTLVRQIARRTTFVISGALTLGGCGSVVLPDVHYRLTVVVDTPEGRRSGSSVVSFESAYSPAIPGPEAKGVRFHLHGEATPIKLPNGNYLFAVLKWEQADAAKPMLLESFADLLPPQVSTSDGDIFNRRLMDQIRALSKLRATRPVKPEYYPVIAWFDDPTRPRTIHAKPARAGTAIVSGVTLRSMTLEITDAPVTWQIRSILPWLHREELGYLDPNIKGIKRTFPEYMLIGADNFLAGEIK